MEKPITVKIDELINNIAHTINESGLPLWLVEQPIKDILAQVSEGAKNEKEHERKAYEESLKLAQAEEVIEEN